MKRLVVSTLLVVFCMGMVLGADCQPALLAVDLTLEVGDITVNNYTSTINDTVNDTVNNTTNNTTNAPPEPAAPPAG